MNVFYPVPGLTQDPSLCLRCRAAHNLCGKPVCPLLLRQDALMRTLSFASTTSLAGTSPPSVFVGRMGYPSVSVGPLLSPWHGDTHLFDMPEEWVGRTVSEIVSFRMGLVRGTERFRVTDATRPGKHVQELQMLAMSTPSVEYEAEFRHPPHGHLTLSDHTPPFGPSAPLNRLRMDVRRIDDHLERAYGDGDATARTSVVELYARGVPVSRIQRMLSVGTVGRWSARKFVPTRWSITAVDDILGLQNLIHVRQLPELNEIFLYRLTALDNRWAILFLPGPWRYESIEAWYPGTLWNPNPYSLVMLGDWEGSQGRTTYASMGGCYYAARLAVTEALERLQRQAGVVILREVHPGSLLPVGVWNVREHVRAALRTSPQPQSSWEDLEKTLRDFFAIPVERWKKESHWLHEMRCQRRLEDFPEV